MNSVMGPGWSFVALSGICILATPMPLIVLRYGPRWRLRRARRAKAKDEEKKRAERERIDGLATAGDQGG